MTKPTTGNPSNVTPVLMPKAGQSMEEGVIVTWRVQPGAQIKKGDIIFEIETDKATMEVEAVDEGVLAKIVIPEGTDHVAVNTPIAVIAENGEDVGEVETKPRPAPPQAKAPPAAPMNGPHPRPILREASLHRPSQCRGVQASWYRANSHGCGRIRIASISDVRL